MLSSHKKLILFVLKHAAEESVLARIELYRAMADVSGDSGDTSDLLVLAQALEEAERKCREFEFAYASSTASADAEAMADKSARQGGGK